MTALLQILQEQDRFLFLVFRFDSTHPIESGYWPMTCFHILPYLLGNILCLLSFVLKQIAQSAYWPDVR